MTDPLPAAPSLRDDLGLSIDMIDVDRLREWARNIEAHGADLTHWASPPFLVKRLITLADNIDTAVRDIGTLRATLLQREREIARLREALAKMPSPIHIGRWVIQNKHVENGMIDTSYQENYCFCCHVRWPFTHNMDQHPDNGCLFVEAQKGSR